MKFGSESGCRKRVAAFQIRLAFFAQNVGCRVRVVDASV